VWFFVAWLINPSLLYKERCPIGQRGGFELRTSLKSLLGKERGGANAIKLL